MSLLIYLFMLALGLVAGLVGRKLRPHRRVNPGLTALVCVLATLALDFALFALAARGGLEPDAAGYLVGGIIGRAGIPLAVAGMLAVFMRDDVFTGD